MDNVFSDAKLGDIYVNNAGKEFVFQKFSLDGERALLFTENSTCSFPIDGKEGIYEEGFTDIYPLKRKFLSIEEKHFITALIYSLILYDKDNHELKKMYEIFQMDDRKALKLINKILNEI